MKNDVVFCVVVLFARKGSLNVAEAKARLFSILEKIE